MISRLRIGAAGVCFMCAVAAQAAEASRPVVVVRAARLLDVETGEMLRDRAVVVDGERIRAIVDGRAPAPAGASVIDLGDATPEVTVPDGIELRPYQAADARAVYQVIEDAFNEWPDREPTTFEGWAAHVISHPAFAPELSRLAFEGSELVGVALCDDYEGQDEGWVPQVATKATHRHRGIARALLQSAFAAFHATGRRQVGLSTDTRTGALTLYERIGMRVRRTYTSWAKDLN